MPGLPQQVLAWTARHVGRSHTDGGLITSLPVPGRPETVWERDYALPPVPGVEDTRELTVEVADAGGGQTAIRVDAQVTWLPARHGQRDGPGRRDRRHPEHDPRPGPEREAAAAAATVTSPEAVRRITAMVNALPVFPPGQRECGLGRGEVKPSCSRSWQPRRGGSSRPPTSARKAASRLSSPWARRRSPATRGPGTPPGSPMLGVPYQGRALAGAILKTAGLKWKLGGYLPMPP